MLKDLFDIYKRLTWVNQKLIFAAFNLFILMLFVSAKVIDESVKRLGQQNLRYVAEQARIIENCTPPQKL